MPAGASSAAEVVTAERTFQETVVVGVEIFVFHYWEPFGVGHTTAALINRKGGEFLGLGKAVIAGFRSDRRWVHADVVNVGKPDVPVRMRSRTATRTWQNFMLDSFNSIGKTNSGDWIIPYDSGRMRTLPK